ncbi:MAG: hypothetical protein ACHQ53_00090 [Polyangiales bacterium]
METPPSKSSSSPTDPAETAPSTQSTQERSYAGAFAKGCGFVVLAIVLGLGVAFVGKGEVESWGAAIVGVIFVVLILGSSGLTGFWNR